MARLLGHGTAKYVTGDRLATSDGRGWQDLLAERWRHTEGDLGPVMPRDTEVIVMLEGNLRVRRRGDGRLQHHDAEPGTVWICPAGIPEDMIHLYGTILDSVHLYLPADPMSRACLEELGLDPAKTTLRYEGGFRDPTVETIARTVADAMRDPDPVSALLAETMSAALGVYLVRHFSEQAPSPAALPSTRGGLDGARLGRVIARMDAGLDEALTLADLAREAALSPFHFARCFKAATGMSPHRYLLDRRLQRARALLLQSAAPLAEIAARLRLLLPSPFHVRLQAADGGDPGRVPGGLGNARRAAPSS